MTRGVKQHGCQVPGCPGKHYGHGLCQAHYTRVRRHDEIGPAESLTRKGILPPPETCAADGCEQPRKALGFCNAHYKRVRANGSPDVVRRIAKGPANCTEPGCDGKHLAKGYCGKHYQRWRARQTA